MKSLRGAVQLFIDSLKNLQLGDRAKGLAKGPAVAAPGHGSSRSWEDLLIFLKPYLLLCKNLMRFFFFWPEKVFL